MKTPKALSTALLSSIFLLLSILTAPAAALEVLRIDRNLPLKGQAPTLTLYPGFGLNLNFRELGEKITKIWLANSSWVDVDYDTIGSDNEAATIVHIKRVPDRDLQRTFNSDRTTLTLVTDRGVYRFILEKGTGTQRYDTVELVPDDPVLAQATPEPTADTSLAEQLQQTEEQAEDLKQRLAAERDRKSQRKRDRKAAEKNQRQQRKEAIKREKQRERAARQLEQKQAELNELQERLQALTPETPIPESEMATAVDIPTPLPVTATQAESVISISDMSPVDLAHAVRRGLNIARNLGEIDYSQRRGSAYYRMQTLIGLLNLGNTWDESVDGAEIDPKFARDILQHGQSQN